MSEEEWLQYYDDNLAQSSADEKRISQLEYMEDQLEDGENIDDDLEEEILDEVKREIETNKDSVSLKAEIEEYAPNDFIRYFVMSTGCGIMALMWAMLR